jgi:hypothetical protein
MTVRKEIASSVRQEGGARNDIMLRLLCLSVEAVGLAMTVRKEIASFDRLCG